MPQSLTFLKPTLLLPALSASMAAVAAELCRRLIKNTDDCGKITSERPLDVLMEILVLKVT